MTTTNPPLEQLIREARADLEEARDAVPILSTDVDEARTAAALEPTAAHQAALKRARAALAAGQEAAEMAEARVAGLTRRIAGERLVKAQAEYAELRTQARGLDTAGRALAQRAAALFPGWVDQFRTLDAELIAHARAADELTRKATSLPSEAGPRLTITAPSPFERHSGAGNNLLNLIGYFGRVYADPTKE